MLYCQKFQCHVLNAFCRLYFHIILLELFGSFKNTPSLKLRDSENDNTQGCNQLFIITVHISQFVTVSISNTVNFELPVIFVFCCILFRNDIDNPPLAAILCFNWHPFCVLLPRFIHVAKIALWKLCMK